MQASERPVYQVSLTEREVARLKRRVRPVMVLSEAEMVALIPNKTGFRFVGCPIAMRVLRRGSCDGQLGIRIAWRVAFVRWCFPMKSIPMIRC